MTAALLTATRHKVASCFVLLLLLFAPLRALGEGVPILAYHRFDPARAGPTTTTVPVFEHQLDWLAAHGYTIVRLRDLVEGWQGRGPAVSGREAVLTVDDGHESVYTYLYPIIRQRHLPVTLFIYPSAISNAPYALTWEQLAEMENSGLVDIQSHTFWHPDFRKERAHRTPQDYRAFVDTQLSRSRAVLEKRLGKPVEMLAWPYGIVDPELEAAAARAGYIAGFAFSGGLARPGADAFAIPRIPVANQMPRSLFAGLLTEATSEK